jgi:multidrug efflux pump subunit AcrA (membrane-fusion protein)
VNRSIVIDEPVVTDQGATAAGSTGDRQVQTGPLSPLTKLPEAAIAARPGPFSRLFVDFIMPLTILTGAIGVFLFLGTREAEQKRKPGNTRAEQLLRLQPAKLGKSLDLKSTDGILDLRADGNVVPFREMQIAAEVSGRVMEKDPLCEAGNFVRAGQALFRIDPSDYQLEVERLGKLRQQEYESLRELEQEMGNTQRLIDLAQQQVELQDKEVERLQKLPAQFASQQELDQAQRNRLTTLNNKVSLDNQLSLLRKRQARLEAAEQLAATQLKKAALDLERCVIRAPGDGVILTENVEVNSFVQRGATLVAIEDMSQAEVTSNLRMDQLYWVLDQESGALDPIAASTAPPSERSYRLPRTPVTIRYRVAGREDEAYTWEGYLARYDGVGLDVASRTVPVRIIVEEPSRYTHVAPDGRNHEVRGPTALVRGMYVEVELHTKPRSELHLVPRAALRPGNRLWRFKPDEGALQTVVVKLDEESSGSPPAEETEPADALAKFDEHAWMPGWIEVLRDVRPLTEVRLPNADGSGDEDYWIVELNSGSLSVGDYLITTPLEGIRGDGTDAVRVERDFLTGNAG